MVDFVGGMAFPCKCSYNCPASMQSSMTGSICVHCGQPFSCTCSLVYFINLFVGSLLYRSIECLPKPIVLFWWIKNLNCLFMAIRSMACWAVGPWAPQATLWLVPTKFGLASNQVRVIDTVVEGAIIWPPVVKWRWHTKVLIPRVWIRGACRKYRQQGK